MTDKPLLLTGANGRTGRAILKALRRHGIPVRAFIRDAAQQDDLLELGAVECALGDMTDSASIRNAVSGVSKILHVGPPMHPNEVPIVDDFIAAAKDEGIDHFIYYSVMHTLRREVRHHRLKLDVEEHLVESGLPYTIVQPSRYMQHLVPIWSQVVNEGVHAMPFDIDKKFNVVDLEDLAEACAVVASSEDYLYGIYELAGPEALSQNDMAAILSDVIGKPVAARAITREELAASARAKGANEDRVEQMLSMNHHYDKHGFRGNPFILEKLLGRPLTTYKSYAERLAAESGT